MIDIYAYENKINGKIYVGQTERLARRDWEHQNTPDESMPIDRAIQKYGRINFNFWVICSVENEGAEQEEIFWIAEMRNQLGRHMVYNISDGGDAFFRGRHHTEESKKAISEKHIGKCKPVETKAKMRAAALADGRKPDFTGRKHTKESKAKMSKALSKPRKPHSQATLEKLSLAKKGCTWIVIDGKRKMVK